MLEGIKLFLINCVKSPLIWGALMLAADNLIPTIPWISPLVWPNLRPIIIAMLAVGGVVLEGVRVQRILAKGKPDKMAAPIQ